MEKEKKEDEVKLRSKFKSCCANAQGGVDLLMEGETAQQRRESRFFDRRGDGTTRQRQVEQAKRIEHIEGVL